MSVIFPIVGGSGAIQRPASSGPKPGGAAKTSFASHVEAVDAEAAQPPDEVRAEVRAAARAADRLHEMGRELRFERDQDSGRVRIELRSRGGELLRQVPPAEVFDFAQGKVTR